MNCANHPDRERVAFCQNCGKPLCAECSRNVGNAVYCEPCLAARLAAAEAATSTGSPYGNVNAPGYAATATAVPPLPGAPNPLFAGLLGLIPGVGAMYNGQYAKGIVHLVIFALLVSLSDSNGIFGLFVAGWVFYQVIEAHHTARARRDGTPLPNPFGLNEIAEKFGFGKSWPAATPSAETAYRPQSPPSPYPPSPNQPGTQTFTQEANGSQSYESPGTYGSAWAPVGASPTPFAPLDPNFPAQRNRFPAGAILLIVLGAFFFIGSSGWFHHFPVHRILPFLLIGTGVWIFVSRMTSTGLSMTDDGSPDYRFRLFHALRGAAWIVLIGLLAFLDSFGILSWSHSWPLFIIVAGLMMAMKRSTYTAGPPVAYAYPSAGPAAPYAPVPAAATSVPVTPHDEEGK